jgi:hypothetical protein
MRCTFYLPYESYDFNGFDYDNSYYSSESYTDALNNSLEESKNAVFMLQNGIKTNRLLNNDTKYSNIEPNHLNNDKEISLSSCEVRIFNEMNNPETIDSIINYNLSNDVFILIVNFDFIQFNS